MSRGTRRDYEAERAARLAARMGSLEFSPPPGIAPGAPQAALAAPPAEEASSSVPPADAPQVKPGPPQARAWRVAVGARVCWCGGVQQIKPGDMFTPADLGDNGYARLTEAGIVLEPVR